MTAGTLAPEIDLEAEMTSEPNEIEGVEGEGDDVGLIGGGGPPATIEGDEAESLDEHGDNLLRVDEDEV